MRLRLSQPQAWDWAWAWDELDNLTVWGDKGLEGEKILYDTTNFKLFNIIIYRSEKGNIKRPRF